MGGNLQNIFMEIMLNHFHPKINHFVLLAIATNIPQRLKTAFVAPGSQNMDIKMSFDFLDEIVYY